MIPSRVRWDEEAPTSIGPYSLLRRIGSGGMATVYEVRDELLARRVALKRLHRHIAEGRGANQRFLREGRAAARIRHPHVVQIFASGEEGGAPYLLMELLKGETLASMLTRVKRVAPAATVDLVLPILAGVAAAHAAGVIHRDLKPSNIFLAADDAGRVQPKVLDFGISKLVAAPDDRDLTSRGTVVGTLGYMAPEQAGAEESTFASDQYALGVLIYQCLTGELPFEGKGMYDLLRAMMTSPAVPPSCREPTVPAGLDAVVLRAMSRDPNRRFPSVGALGAALLPFASELARIAWASEFHALGTDTLQTAPLVDREHLPRPTATASMTGAARRRLAHSPRLLVAMMVTGCLAVTGWVAVRRAPPRNWRQEAAAGRVAAPVVPVLLAEREEFAPPAPVAVGAPRERGSLVVVPTRGYGPRRVLVSPDPARVARLTGANVDDGGVATNNLAGQDPVRLGTNEAPILP